MNILKAASAYMFATLRKFCNLACVRMELLGTEIPSDSLSHSQEEFEV